jgi:hypothetical protein
MFSLLALHSDIFRSGVGAASLFNWKVVSDVTRNGAVPHINPDGGCVIPWWLFVRSNAPSIEIPSRSSIQYTTSFVLVFKPALISISGTRDTHITIKHCGRWGINVGKGKQGLEGETSAIFHSDKTHEGYLFLQFNAASHQITFSSRDNAMSLQSRAHSLFTSLYYEDGISAWRSRLF